MRGTSYALFLQLEAIDQRTSEHWEEQDRCQRGYKTRDPDSPNEELRLVFALVVHDASVIVPQHPVVDEVYANQLLFSAGLHKTCDVPYQDLARNRPFAV